jgi:hypothetical protein
VDAYIVTAVVEFLGMEDIYSAPKVNCPLQQQTKERFSDTWCWIKVLLVKEHAQVDVLHRVLSAVEPRCERVLVLHLRGPYRGSNAAVYGQGLYIVHQYCARHQSIHLHCFTGGSMGGESVERGRGNMV